MAELGNPKPNKPKKAKITVWHVIAVALVGIFITLLLSNIAMLQIPLLALKRVLKPIAIGLVLAYVLNFFLRFFEYKIFRRIKKRTVNRALSMFSSYILFFALITGMLLLIVPRLIDSIENITAHGDEYLQDLLDGINRLLAPILSNIDLPFLEQPEDGINFLTLKMITDWLLELLSGAGGSLNAVWSKIVDIATGTVTGAIGILTDLLVGFFISIYVLLSKERLGAGCRRVFRALLPEKTEKLSLSYISRAHSKFGGYIFGKLIDSTMVMFVCMLLFTLFDIPEPILISVIIGVTDVIPFFGPFLGAIPSALLIFLIEPWKMFLFILLILVVQQIDGNLLAPLILGDRTGLSSLGVIIAVSVMGDFFGIVGLLIGVPVFALIISMLDDFIKYRLKKKGHPTALKHYYPADAFIRPSDEDEERLTGFQRFGRWVAAVETEQASEDAPRGFWHALGRGIRKVFLAIGRFFHHLFSIKPIPEDRTGGIFHSISQNGIATNRLFWRTLLLTVVTLGVYPLYMTEYIAQSVNLSCHKDGKRTWGFFPFICFSVLTLGIFPLIWHCKIINRWNDYCKEENMEPVISKRFYLCWSLPGLLTVIGPLIAAARFLRAFSGMAQHFNATHTFPLSENAISIAPIKVEEPTQRKSLIEQIISPEEDSSDVLYENENDEEDELVEKILASES